MTLYNFDEDQMVPQVNIAAAQNHRELTLLEVATGGGGADSTLNTPTLTKPSPDFDSILSGLADEDYPCSWTDPEPLSVVVDADLSMYPMSDPAEAYRSLGEPVHEQDLTFYDDQPVGSMTIKQEKADYGGDDYGVLSPSSHHQQQGQQVVGSPTSSTGHGSQMLGDEDEQMRKGPNEHLPDESQNDIDAVTKEIDGVCSLLNIPVSPYQWTVDQVSKWAAWTLEQYNLPACYLYDLKIDGTTLCLLHADEFKLRWPLFGEYLFAQLEVWKGAYYNIKAEASPTELYDETPTYMNLEPATQEQHPQHHQQPSHSHQQQPQLHHHHQQHAHHQLQHQQHPHHTHYQQHHHHQHQQQPQPPQPAYIPMTQTSTSPTPSPCHSMYGSDMMLSSSVVSSVEAIPKPVLTSPLHCGANLSPASSLDSMDSFASSPASEADFERSFGPATMQPDTRPEVTPSKQNIHLWQFLRELLIQHHNYGSAIRWLDRSKGIFKIEDSARVAKLWGQRKNRPAMNYDKLSRSIRQYYKKGIIKKTDNSKRLVYQFCPQYRV